jgi:Domain of unknown function (DUF4276)
MDVNYVLISDGTSDRALIPVIDFTLKTYHADILFKGQRADFSRLLKKPKDLSEKILCAIDLFDSSILFVHRDSENEKPSIRDKEIENAIEAVAKKINEKKFVKVIPVRMTEAWLLINEKAIRKASGNPKDPKNVLESLIKESSQLSSRRLKSLNLRMCIQLVSQHIDDFTPLRDLSSYNHFEEQVRNLQFT